MLVKIGADGIAEFSPLVSIWLRGFEYTITADPLGGLYITTIDGPIHTVPQGSHHTVVSTKTTPQQKD